MTQKIDKIASFLKYSLLIGCLWAGSCQPAPLQVPAHVLSLAQGILFQDAHGQLFLFDDEQTRLPTKTQPVRSVLPLLEGQHLLLKEADDRLILTQIQNPQMQMELQANIPKPVATALWENKLWVLEQSGQLFFFQDDGTLAEQKPLMPLEISPSPIPFAVALNQGERIALVYQGRLLIFNLKTQREEQGLGLLPAEVTSLVTGEQGHSFAVGCQDGSVQLYVWQSILQRYELAFKLGRRGSKVVQLSLSEQGQRMLVVDSEGQGQVYQFDGYLCQYVSLASGLVGASINQAGTQVWGLTPDEKVARYQLQDGCFQSPITYGLPNNKDIQKGHIAAVNSAVFSPDGTQILTASGDMTARLWNASGQVLKIFGEPDNTKPDKGHIASVGSVEFSPDGTQILTASFDKTAKLWNTSGQVLKTFSGHTKAVNSAVFSSDGTQILTASGDTTARLWNTSGQVLKVFGEPDNKDPDKGHIDWIRYAVFSPDGTQILTASDDTTVKRWDPALGILITYGVALNKDPDKGHTSFVTSAVFSPDGTKILTASVDSTIRLWDPISGKLLKTFSIPTGSSINAVFSPDGTKILTASFDNTARLWDPVSGKLLKTLGSNKNTDPDKGHIGPVIGAMFSPDGSMILTASNDTTAKLWSQQAPLLGTFSLSPNDL